MQIYEKMASKKIPISHRPHKCGSSGHRFRFWAILFCRLADGMLTSFPTFWPLIQPTPQLVPLTSTYPFPEAFVFTVFPGVKALIPWNLMLSSLSVLVVKGCPSRSHRGDLLLVASFLPTASVSSVHVRFHCSDLFTCPWDVFRGTLNSKTLLLTVFRMEGNWQSNRTRKIESYYCSLGSLALLPVFDSAHFQHLLLRVLIDRWPPKCLCQSIAPASYWQVYWQLSLGMGISGLPANRNLLRASGGTRKILSRYWHYKWRQFT